MRTFLGNILVFTTVLMACQHKNHGNVEFHIAKMSDNIEDNEEFKECYKVMIYAVIYNFGTTKVILPFDDRVGNDNKYKSFFEIGYKNKYIACPASKVFCPKDYAINPNDSIVLLFELSDFNLAKLHINKKNFSVEYLSRNLQYKYRFDSLDLSTNNLKEKNIISKIKFLDNDNIIEKHTLMIPIGEKKYK